MEIIINNLKNIKSMKYDFPIQQGIYALAGENGCGKTTIMNVFASVIKTSNLIRLKFPYLKPDTYIKLSENNKFNEWSVTNGKLKSPSLHIYRGKMISNLHIDGFYEGSIFSGTRFEDIKQIQEIIENLKEDDIEKPSEDFRKKFSYILHGDYDHYHNLYCLKDEKMKKKQTKPYFLKFGNSFVGKYDMSSGECMLVTLLNFIYSITKNNPNNTILFCIDEVELALHPSAISRLIDYLEELVQKYNLTVYFSTHSAHVIKRLPPQNIFFVKTLNGEVHVENPCYPQYAIKSFYEHDGYDVIILTEDKVSAHVVKNVIRNSNYNNILINVIPVGGWSNVLELQKAFLEQNVMGVRKILFSVIDGDVVDKVKEKIEYKDLKKLFLPIQSVEKYLFEKLYVHPDYEFIKKFGDKYFRIKSLDSIIKEFKTSDAIKDNKGLYRHLLKELANVKISEDEFCSNFAEDIYKDEKMQEKLGSKIEKFITNSYKQ